MQCGTCKQYLKNTNSALKDHNYNYHVDEVFVGESLLVVRRIHGTFTCYICDKALKTTTGFKLHLVSHSLKMTIDFTSLPEPKNSLRYSEDVSDSMPPSEIIHHIPPEDLIIGNSSKPHKKRKLLSHSQTVLASSGSITAGTKEKTDKLMIAKLGRWVPIIFECESEQHGLLTSARSATMLLQESPQTGAWKKPAADVDPSTGVPCITDDCSSDSLVEHIKSTSFVREEFLADGSSFILYQAQSSATLLEIHSNVTKISLKRSIEKCLEIQNHIDVQPFLVLLCTDKIRLSVKSMLSPDLQNPHWQTLNSTFWAEKCLVISKDVISFSEDEASQHLDPLVVLAFYVAQRTMASRFPGGYAFPSEPWAADCIILSKESLGEGDIDTPLNSLIALGLFFTSRALSIVNDPFADDPKMQYLYTLALSHEEDQHNNILLPLLESQNREYERLLSLANTVGSPDVLIQAINDAKSRNDTLKRKDDSDPVGSLSNKRTATATNSSASSSINNKNDQYKQGMDFVEQFKQARIQKGHKKMDWITCLKE
ncbi:hypothetical protein, partial, partial [Parasitella parasitica]